LRHDGEHRDDDAFFDLQMSRTGALLLGSRA
jgi:hypothetical protein